MGFATWSSIPAARQSARSELIVLTPNKNSARIVFQIKSGPSIAESAAKLTAAPSTTQGVPAGSTDPASRERMSATCSTAPKIGITANKASNRRVIHRPKFLCPKRNIPPYIDRAYAKP